VSDSALARGLIASQISEAISNYALADDPLAQPISGTDGYREKGKSVRRHGYIDAWHDEQLWHELTEASLRSRQPAVRVKNAAISEWVARVPGLFWHPRSMIFKGRLGDGMEVGGSEKLTLGLESLVVSGGGVGTIRLQPADDGYRLVTLTPSGNASTGVPALISPDVWAACALAEGSLVSGVGTVTTMSQRWASQFPIMAGIPRLCLVFDKPDAIAPDGVSRPVLAHPFALMEYWDGVTLMHDFVFAAVETTDPGFRSEATKFFEGVRTRKGRQGTYLTSADVSDPMWDASFESPADMRDRAVALRVVEARIAETMKGSDVIDALLRRLSLMDVENVRRMGTFAGIPLQRWSKAGLPGEEALRLVDAAVLADRIPALLYEIKIEDNI
jgi:hypothetical protein